MMSHTPPEPDSQAAAHCMLPTPPWHIGLTGGIGSGKSTISHWLAQAGAVVLDADAIARHVTGPQGAAIPAIAAQFGPSVLNAQGALDRAAMRQLAFSQPQALQALQSIIHPLVQHSIQQQAAQARAQQPPLAMLVYDIPLLVETGHWYDQLHHILVVDCDEATQIARVSRRSGLEREQIQAIMARQATRSQRLHVASAVIQNGADTTLHALHDQVSRWAQPFGIHLTQYDSADSPSHGQH